MKTGDFLLFAYFLQFMRATGIDFFKVLFQIYTIHVRVM